MEFEYDPNKSAANVTKHGIDFEQAQMLWRDEKRVEFPTQYVEEERWVVIGMIDAKCWTAVVTYRNDCIRLISVRRARDEERELYESD